MNGEEFREWLRKGAPLEEEKPKTGSLDPSYVEALKTEPQEWQREILGEFRNAGDDVIATMTPNGLQIEVVERVPVGMEPKNRRRASRNFKISREKLANMSQDEAKAFFVEKLQSMGVEAKNARNLVETRLTFSEMPKSPIKGKSATTVIIDDPLQPLEVTGLQITLEENGSKLTVDAQTNRGMKRVEFNGDEMAKTNPLAGETAFEAVKREVVKKLTHKEQENVKKWFEDNDGMKPYPTNDGKAVEPEGQRVLGVDWGSGGDKTAVAAFRKRSDGTLVLEDFETFDEEPNEGGRGKDTRTERET